MDRCNVCGGASVFNVLADGASQTYCASCLDRAFPDIRPGALRKAFVRPRRLDGRCPHCGCSEQDMAETALVGCPLCYEALDMRSISTAA
jgi:hypothetical protein